MRLSHPLERLPAATLVACVFLCLTSLRGNHDARAQAPGPLEASAAEQEGAQEPVQIPVPEPEPVADATLETLHEEPADWLGRRVRFVLQHHSTPAGWDPGLTRFGSVEYLALLAWTDRQLPWLAEEHQDPHALMFVRRGSALEGTVSEARTYQRFEAVGRVAQVFLGRPWIELESLERLPEEVGEGAVLHASRALGSMRTGSWKLALEDLRRASASNLPRHAREELQRLTERCKAALEDPQRHGANRAGIR